MRNPLSVCIIKPVNGVCNICCDYCYMHLLLEPQRSNRATMTTETLSATIDFFCSNQDEVEFIWHGGEPLLAGMEFYHEVVRLQEVWQSRGKKIANFIQTNGTLVDEGWGKLFAKHNFYVGVSLDAPPNVHNALRVNTAGLSSLQKTLEGISILKQYDVFIGVTCCVGKSNYLRPEKILSFFLELGIKSIKFLRIKGNNHEAITAHQYADFLIKIFNLWLELDDVDLEIRDIKSIVNLLFGGEFRECWLTGRCDRYATVYSDGTIFTCDSFRNEPHLQFGTVFESYSEVLRSSNFRNFLATIEKAKEPCKSCRWQLLCRGGCLKDRIGNENSDMCSANKRLFVEIESSLKKYGLLV